MVYRQGGITRDFITVWVLPIAILLPPFYAIVTPIPLYVLTQFWVFRGIVYRRVFTVSAIALSYGAASVLFRVSRLVRGRRDRHRRTRADLGGGGRRG